jgi:ABC-type transport system involved in multi-copper enzyme maturation permease subunit
MTASAITRRPAGPAGHGGDEKTGFGSQLHAEWTKFRTVRGWVIAMIMAVLLTVLVGVFAAGAASIGCGPTTSGRACLPSIPIGPGGEAVADNFYFVHRPLAGNGSITARLTSLTGRYGQGNGPVQAGQAGQAGQALANMTPGLVPWAKAGIIIQPGTRPGSAYAAVMATGSHGVRMQYDYTGDIAGLPGTVTAGSPRWLRLSRAGDTITGWDSVNGSQWIRIGTATLSGLPAVAQIGLFTTSPQHVQITTSLGGSTGQTTPSIATAKFDKVSGSGGAAGTGGWTGTAVGGTHSATPMVQGASGYRQSGAAFTVTGTGDIAPMVTGPGAGYPNATLEQSLVGAFAGLIAIVVVAAMFFTSEYRRGLIRVTLAASPRRGRVLAAKAVIAGAVAFAVGLVAAVISLMIGVPRERAQGLYVMQVSALTEARVVIGTAALLAVAAMLAVGVGAVVRRSGAAVAVAITVTVVPYLLAMLGVFPAGVTAWLLRLTPAAGFAIQQSIPQYPQVDSVYSPANGYFPLSPWAGFAVLCAYAAAALALALVLLRRRDA